MEWSNRYVGLPFRDGANGPDAFDCWGLVRKVMSEQFNLQLPALDYARDQEERWALVRTFEPEFHLTETPRDGALVLCAVNGRRAHLGVCVGGHSLLHMTKNQGAVVVPLESSRVKNGITGYYLPNSR